MVAECVKTRQSRRCGEQCRRCRRLSRFCYSGLQRKNIGQTRVRDPRNRR
jgi:hypothetical protein